jgi:YrbI family 3-deoxy-D-manno-octulosonate 8-phosphate phosphatase
MYKKINIKEIDAIIIDFDGVLTCNSVYVDQKGNELTKCSRSDGLAFDVLRKLKIPVFILSTEKSEVVIQRAKKLQVQVFNGVNDKSANLNKLVNQERFKFSKLLYVGNDLNDFHAMQLCGYSACPADSHKEIRRISEITLKTNGGQGVIRELVEDIFGLDFLNILFLEQKK